MSAWQQAKADTAAKQAAKQARRDAKEAAKKQARGGELLLMLQPMWHGLQSYYLSGTGDISYKGQVIGHARDWEASYEMMARGPAAMQTKGGEQYGATGHLTIVCGDYVKVWQVETTLAGAGSHVHTGHQESCIKSNILARKAASAA